MMWTDFYVLGLVVEDGAEIAGNAFSCWGCLIHI
jgi:hypothetical protein